MGQITNGVDKIEVGPSGVNGAMGTSLAILGYTNIDSGSFQEADGTTTDFNVEEKDSPIFSRVTPGKITIAFQIANPDLNTFLAVFGGTITGSGSSAIWNAPQTRQQKDMSFKITPKVGYIIQVPRATLTAKFNASLGKNNLVMVDISADVLNPDDPSIAPYMIGGTVDGTGGTPGTAQTITFAPLGSKSIATNSPLTLTGTSSSGLPLTYMSTDPTKATINGNVATLLATGTVNIVATQMGNTVYAAATPVVNALTITT